MFHLAPWKKRHGESRLREPESTRQGPREAVMLPRLREEYDDLFSKLFEDRLSSELSERSKMQEGFDNWNLGWEDQEQAYAFEAALPGYEPEDIAVNLSGNLLTVRAERKSESKDESGSHFYRYGSFTKRLTIPRGVKMEALEADYRNGVLCLRLPKDEKSATRRIEVKRS
jgi:HSP20 family protein